MESNGEKGGNVNPASSLEKKLRKGEKDLKVQHM
jgi:hypothetical protein